MHAVLRSDTSMADTNARRATLMSRNASMPPPEATRLRSIGVPASTTSALYILVTWSSRTPRLLGRAASDVNRGVLGGDPWTAALLQRLAADELAKDLASALQAIDLTGLGSGQGRHRGGSLPIGIELVLCAAPSPLGTRSGPRRGRADSALAACSQVTSNERTAISSLVISVEVMRLPLPGGSKRRGQHCFP